MLRINEKCLWFYTSFFLFFLGFFSNSLAMYECTKELSRPLKREYDEHDFQAACREGNAEAVQFFIDQAPLISGFNYDPVDGLVLAAQKGHVDVVQMLINTGGVNLNQPINDGATPLFIAAQNDLAEVVQILVNTVGVALNQPKNDGATPLFIAAQKGFAEVVQILVNTEGVALNPPRNDGVTPLAEVYSGSERLRGGGSDFSEHRGGGS